MFAARKRLKNYFGRRNLESMKPIHLITIAGLLLCLDSLHAQESNTNDLSGKLMTTFGEVSRSDSPWTVSVSAADRTFQISYHYVPASDTNSSGAMNVSSAADWRAQSGWFVFIENNERAWAYDGDKNLFLQTAKNSKLGATFTCYGSHTFPCRVPDAVLTRLTPEARKAIKIDKW
jgi:hypothetical protein